MGCVLLYLGLLVIMTSCVNRADVSVSSEESESSKVYASNPTVKGTDKGEGNITAVETAKLDFDLKLQQLLSEESALSQELILTIKYKSKKPWSGNLLGGVKYQQSHLQKGKIIQLAVGHHPMYSISCDIISVEPKGVFNFPQKGMELIIHSPTINLRDSEPKAGGVFKLKISYEQQGDYIYFSSIERLG